MKSLDPMNEDLTAGVRIARGPVKRINPRAVDNARARASDRCEMPWCRAAAALVPHHLTYERAGHELARDLIMICEPCHEDFWHAADCPKSWLFCFSFHRADGAVFIPGQDTPPDTPWAGPIQVLAIRERSRP